MFLQDVLSKEMWCIAGGYAACPALAADIDMWVYNVPLAELEERRAHLLWLLAQAGYRVMTQDDEGTLPLQEDYVVPDDRPFIAIRKVGLVTDPIHRKKGRPSRVGKPIHLMVSTAPSIWDILDHFDVSTHAVAISANGAVVRHPKWTPPQTAPRRLLVANPKTDERMARIRKRFGHDAPSVEALFGI